jgi:hypothetical protein
MYNRVDFFLRKNLFNGGGIADVSPNQTIVRAFTDAFKVPQITGVGKFIEVYHSPAGIVLMQQPDKIRPDETAASGDQNCSSIFHVSSF